MLTVAFLLSKLFGAGEPVTNGKLNLAQRVVASLEGAASTSQLEDRAVTAVKAENFGAWFHGTCTGTANAQAVAITSGLAAPVDGTEIVYQALATNTDGTVTIDVTATPGGAWTQRNVREISGVSLPKGRIRAGHYIRVRYSATNTFYQLLSVSPEPPTRYAVTTGSSNAFVLTFGTTTGYPTVQSYADIAGKPIYARANFDVTGATTLNIDGLGAKSLKKEGNAALANGNIVTDQVFGAVYDAGLDVFLMITPVIPSSSRATVPVRQTVLGGPVDANGHPVLLAYSGQNVTLKATSTDPLVLAFAYGFDDAGAVDYIARLTADVSNAWTLSTTDATYYLFADRDISTGAITYGSTTTRPVYVDDDAAAVTSGVHTFLKNRMKMYAGDASSAVEKQRVFIGEAVVSGGAITSVTSYVLKGRFQSATDQSISALGSDQAFTETHKLGLPAEEMDVFLVAQTTTLNYAAGDLVNIRSITNSTSVYRQDYTFQTPTQLGWHYKPSISTAAYIPNKTTGAITAIANASDFKVRFIAKRGW